MNAPPNSNFGFFFWRPLKKTNTQHGEDSLSATVVCVTTFCTFAKKPRNWEGAIFLTQKKHSRDEFCGWRKAGVIQYPELWFSLCITFLYLTCSSSQAGGSVWVAGSSSSSAATGDHQHVIKAALNTKTGRTIFQGVGLECPLLFIAEECCLCIFLFNFITPTFTCSLFHLPTTELLTTHKQAGSPCRCPCTLPGWLCIFLFIMFLVIKVNGSVIVVLMQAPLLDQSLLGSFALCDYLVYNEVAIVLTIMFLMLKLWMF